MNASSTAVDAGRLALPVFIREDIAGDDGEDLAQRVLGAAHNPSLGLEGSVCLRTVLVPLYREHPVTVARLCDEVLDRSGRLLGELRDAAHA